MGGEETVHGRQKHAAIAARSEVVYLLRQAAIGTEVGDAEVAA